MAKGLFSLTSTGLKEFIAEMEGLAAAIPEISKKSLVEQQRVVEQKIQENWTSMAGGTPGGYVYSSVGQSTAFSKNSPATVVGTVGVYKIDRVASQFGKTEKDLNAAQIAYWVEFGTSRLKSGARKQKGAQYDDSQLVGVRAVPFISNAFYSSMDMQQEAFKTEFNRLADMIRYTGA